MWFNGNIHCYQLCKWAQTTMLRVLQHDECCLAARYGVCSDEKIVFRKDFLKDLITFGLWDSGLLLFCAAVLIWIVSWTNLLALLTWSVSWTTVFWLLWCKMVVSQSLVIFAFYYSWTSWKHAYEMSLTGHLRMSERPEREHRETWRRRTGPDDKTITALGTSYQPNAWYKNSTTLQVSWQIHRYNWRLESTFNSRVMLRWMEMGLWAVWHVKELRRWSRCIRKMSCPRGGFTWRRWGLSVRWMWWISMRRLCSKRRRFGLWLFKRELDCMFVNWVKVCWYDGSEMCLYSFDM